MQSCEIEMVFEASAGQLRRLPRALRSMAATVRARPRRLVEDEYLDTPDRLLMRAGVACRVRRSGAGTVLTLKSLAPFREGLAERAEWTEPLPGGDRTWPGPLPGRKLRGLLRPLGRRLVVDRLFALRQERRVYEVEVPGGASFEVSADRFGGVSKRAEVLCRIEVELKAGPVESLARFARDLGRRLKLESVAGSKFEYGLRASGLAPCRPVGGGGSAARIGPGDAAPKAAGRALALHVERMLWVTPGTRLGMNPECLHDMRVSVRRLRAVLRLFRDALPPAATARLAAELKWLGGSLGAPRDLDVHLQQCAALFERRPPSERASGEVCRRELLGLRAQAYEVMCRDLDSPRFPALVESCRALIARLDGPLPGRSASVAEASSALLTRQLKKILKSGRAMDGDTPDEELHALRVRCKHLRYACETLRGVYGKPAARLARRLATLQDALGAHQDAVAAQALIAQMAAESEARPDGAVVARALVRCAEAWGEERRSRRAVCCRAWRSFDRKKGLARFVKALRARV